MGLDQSIRRIEGEEAVEVAYFRKVNFLHRWVEQHLNGGAETNCDDVPFSLEAMAGLMRTCAQVLADPALGPSLLPTQEGFFFGGTDYGESYLYDVREVFTVLANIMADEGDKSPPGSGQYVYWSWW